MPNPRSPARLPYVPVSGPKAWRRDYNCVRPHRALDNVTPEAFAGASALAETGMAPEEAASGMGSRDTRTAICPNTGARPEAPRPITAPGADFRDQVTGAGCQASGLDGRSADHSDNGRRIGAVFAPGSGGSGGGPRSSYSVLKVCPLCTNSDGVSAPRSGVEVSLAGVCLLPISRIPLITNDGVSSEKDQQHGARSDSGFANSALASRK